MDFTNFLNALTSTPAAMTTASSDIKEASASLEPASKNIRNGLWGLGLALIIAAIVFRKR